MLPDSLRERRRFLKQLGTAAAVAPWILRTLPVASQERGERPEASPEVTRLNPCDRVPMSFIIDDSCCLVNLAHYCIPQFAEVFPDRYLQDWKKLPREIPDAFVRKFGEWCQDHGVKGKYSVVPNPALVGWVDRDLPGWSRSDLQQSLTLVRDFMQPNWDIHPEMVTHTWAIDTRTGRPFPERDANHMENWGWSVGKSADQLADYLSYALRILKNAGLDCEGVTTPGGFGNRSREALSLATFQACRDVYGTEVPHYFRHLFTDDQSVAPRVENARGLNSDNPQCVVSIIGCTGDWFGGWDGLTPGSVDKLITEDLQGGRLPEVIDRGEPAIMVCHWPGIYYNGSELGFDIFKQAVQRVHARNNNLIWMKLSEIARYWAAKELTSIKAMEDRIRFQAPFGTPQFTFSLKKPSRPVTPHFTFQGQVTALKEVKDPLSLTSNTFVVDDAQLKVCLDLPRGQSDLRWS